jgi:hypothetical protein
MKYQGKIEDIVSGSAELKDEIFILKLGNKIVTTEKGKTSFDSFKQAQKALEKIVYSQFCHGHYWHKGKNNTFEQEGGWLRNNGNVDKNAKEFAKFATEMTKQLLIDKIFEIKKI